MRVSRFLSAILIVFLAVLFNSALLAQTITGTISGDVTDSTGAVVANVSITVQTREPGFRVQQPRQPAAATVFLIFPLAPTK